MSANAQQQRGQRKSPFIGRRTPLVENGSPLLYPRYTHVSEILLDKSQKVSQAPAAAAAAFNTPKLSTPVAANLSKPLASQLSQPVADSDGGAGQRASAQEALLARISAAQRASEQAQQSPATTSAAGLTPVTVSTPQPEGAGEAPKRKRDKPKREKKKKREADAAAAAASATPAADEQQQQRKKAKKEKPAPPDGSKQVSGPGNADEAASIRAALGFGAPPAAAAAPVAVTPVATPAAGGLSFGFGFQPAPAAAAADSSSEESSDDEPVAAGAAPVYPTTTAYPPQPAGNAVEQKSRPAVAPRPVPAAAPAPLPSAPAEPGQGYVDRRVFAGGMPYGYEEDDVREYWSYCGDIEAMDLMRFPDTGRFKGMAFITFGQQAGYEAALACNGSELDGQMLRVDRCKAPKAKKEAADPVSHPTPNAEKVPGYYVAYVGNIAFEAEADELREVFADCGVTQVRLHTDKATGRSKGYAHVHFPDEGLLDMAVALNGTELHSRNLKVGYAQRKKT